MKGLLIFKVGCPVPNDLPENIRISNIIWTQQVIFRNIICIQIYIFAYNNTYMNMYMHAIIISGKSYAFEEQGRFREGRKEREKCCN